MADYYKDESSERVGQPPVAASTTVSPDPGVQEPSGEKAQRLHSAHDQAEAQEAQDDSDVKSIAESIGNQRLLLSGSRLIVSFSALAMTLFVSFIDQTSVSTSIPAISEELNTGTATSWIGASFLIASVAFQLINGRLSDIFGRKNLLLIYLALMAVGDLLAGFSRTPGMLFAFRAIAGIGGGGINSIVMIIISDITTLQNRGKYQGILGAVLALANGTGPFIGGALVEHVTWRWVFWIVPMLAVPAGVVILLFLPLRHDKGHYAAKVKRIDFGGIVINLAAVLLILVPLTGGGVTYAWTSPKFVCMIVFGAVLAIAFVLYEWKWAPLPIMPLHLYRAPHCAVIYTQSFFSGLNFYGNFFYCNIYFQEVLGYQPLQSGALILPIILLTSIFSVLSGLYMNRYCLYMPSIVVGFVLWTLATGLRCTFTKDTSLGAVIGILCVEGIGIGCTLQPTLVGLYANSKTEDRAVITGLRNFMRTIGGTIGLVASGAILSNTLNSRLSSVPSITIGAVDGPAARLHGRDDHDDVVAAYMVGLHHIFIFYACSAGINLLLTVGVGNTSLRPKEKPSTEASDGNGVVGQSEDGGESETVTSPDQKKQEEV